ncbi:reverse transcriptase domain, reverse transcriptase zinc-binding domain protein [Tanacetum coccineum]
MRSKFKRLQHDQKCKKRKLSQGMQLIQKLQDDHKRMQKAFEDVSGADFDRKNGQDQLFQEHDFQRDDSHWESQKVQKEGLKRKEHARDETLLSRVDAFSYSNVNDVGSSGGKKFTRISDDGLKFSKLDWFLTNSCFCENWSSLAVVAKERKLSDHCPLVLNDKVIDFGPKPFRCFDIWMEDMECERIMAECWRKMVQNDHDIDALKNEATKWEIVAESRDLDVVELERWKEARRQWIEKDKCKNEMIRQKAKSKWALEGDENSKFFHACINYNNRKTRLNGLMIDGLWCEDPVAIIAKVISNEDKEELEQDVEKEERYWSIIRTDLLKAIKSFWDTDTISAEGLNVTIKEAVSYGYFIGVKIGRSAIPVSHLQYEDDKLVFGEWKYSNARNLMRIIECVKQASGLKINSNKTKVYGIEVPNGEIKAFANHMGISPGKMPFTYLGIPIGVNMKRVNSWIIVVEKFKKRWGNWKTKMISFGGRLTLVKSVLGSLDLYFFSLFRAPMSVLKNLESMRSNFFRGEMMKIRKWHGLNGK